jgi:hypothetical protein
VAAAASGAAGSTGAAGVAAPPQAEAIITNANARISIRKSEWRFIRYSSRVLYFVYWSNESSEVK